MTPQTRKALVIGGVVTLGVLGLFAVYQLVFGSAESSSGAAIALTTAAAAATRKAVRDQVFTSLTEWITDAKAEKGDAILEAAQAAMGESDAEIDQMTLEEKIALANMEAPPLPIRTDIDKEGP